MTSILQSLVASLFVAAAALVATVLGVDFPAAAKAYPLELGLIAILALLIGAFLSYLLSKSGKEKALLAQGAEHQRLEKQLQETRQALMEAEKSSLSYRESLEAYMKAHEDAKRWRIHEEQERQRKEMYHSTETD